MTQDKELLLTMYYTMKKVRRFEETVEELYKRGTIPGFVHLYTGEEAVATGVCLALRQDDYIVSTHRGHGHVIAKGGDVNRLLAELCGRHDGYSRGKGGSMHAADLSLGILGANGIVGGGFGIATGAALSAKKRNSDQVTVCFFGDGAVNQGIFMEVANIAAVWKLPIVYICENNVFGEYTRSSAVTAGRLDDRAAALGLCAATVDGNSVLDVYDVAKEAVDRARAGRGPSFIEARTYRFSGHHAGDVIPAEGDYYRTLQETEERWKLEPIAPFRSWLIEEQVFSATALDQVDRQVENEIEQAVAFAMTSPEPDLTELMEHVYV